ncbi:hypothetical protein NZD89_16830 [Alicyclobacillus fastidiosus]|uniref:Extracellular solute-binding protein n=1 Tax=Alicyclobacillus fastidiosus TaxID=392011 RepID=A0ABY6ZB06_9BACL|nr:hypothetical protein [Alicyclobacillus fastidiosus]WAH40051.1 hypothetical protein NZD89_16830 [Alicyclobacillus fastidiosus]GMA61357.1 hypothetical protein GCM10025859_17970 [Alicyclobacillus fastidiosus]
MSKMPRKWAVLTVLAVSASSILTGCSSNDIQNSSKTQSPGPETLTWFSDINWWTMSPWNSNPNTVEGQITQKTGLKFDFNVPAQDADTKLNLMMVSGKLPDVISLQDGAAEQQLIASGKVWNLEDLFKEYDPSALKTIFPADLVKLEDQQLGGFYAVPSYASTPGLTKLYPPAVTNKATQYSNNNAIIFNQHIMKQAGITLSQLKTESGVLAALNKIASMHLTYKGAPVIPLQVDNSSAWLGSSVESLAQMFGAMPIDKQGNYRDLMLAPETKQAIDFYFQAAQEGALDQSELTLDTNGTNNAVRSGRVFCFIGNTANPHPETMWQTDPTETWISPGPLLSETNYKPTYGNQTYGLGWTQTYVSKAAPDPAAIAKWLAFMYGSSGQLLINYGIKGTDYTINSKGLVTPTAASKKLPSNYWETTGLGGFWAFYNSAWGAHAALPPTDKSDLMIDQFKSAYPSSSLTYRYDSTALQMPASTIPASSTLYNDEQQINTYESTQVAKMIFAPNSTDENQIYQQTVSQLHKMGIDQIDNTINAEFHKQEKAFGEDIKGINP